MAIFSLKEMNERKIKRKNLKNLIIVLLIFTACTQAKQNTNKYSWGGKGYDHGGSLHSRFTAKIPSASHSQNVKEKDLIIIDFDGKETHTSSLESIELLTENGQKTTSNKCWLSQRHINAPYSCSFAVKEVAKLSAKGYIILNLRDHSFLKEEIDFDKLSFFAKKFIKNDQQ